MSKSAPKRQRRDADARPDEILDAALTEFTARGFDAARMEDVAQAAGISKAGVYLYFESKEALLKALIERKLSPVIQQADALARAGAADPEAAMRLIAEVLITRLADPRIFAVPRLVIGLSGRFPEIARHYRQNVVEHARAAFETLIRAGIARGVFRDVDPQAATRAFIGPLLFEAMWTHVLQGETALNDAKKLVSDQMDLLLNGMTKEHSA